MCLSLMILLWNKTGKNRNHQSYLVNLIKGFSGSLYILLNVCICVVRPRKGNHIFFWLYIQMVSTHCSLNNLLLFFSLTWSRVFLRCNNIQCGLMGSMGVLRLRSAEFGTQFISHYPKRNKIMSPSANWTMIPLWSYSSDGQQEINSSCFLQAILQGLSG